MMVSPSPSSSPTPAPIATFIRSYPCPYPSQPIVPSLSLSLVPFLSNYYNLFSITTYLFSNFKHSRTSKQIRCGLTFWFPLFVNFVVILFL